MVLTRTHQGSRKSRVCVCLYINICYVYTTYNKELAKQGRNPKGSQEVKIVNSLEPHGNELKLGVFIMNVVSQCHIHILR